MSLIDYLAEKKIKQMVGHERGGHNAWIPMFFEKKVGPSSNLSSLTVSILQYCIYFRISTCVPLLVGLKWSFFFVLNIKENR